MKRIVLRILLGLAAVLVLLVGGIAAATVARWDRTFDVPEPALAVVPGPDLVERGRYLAYGPAHCAYCHTTQDQWPRIDAGETVPLSGGYALKLPLGTYYAPNLTPDPETGIGRVTDGQIARMLRHNVRSSGRAALPFMEFQNLSDEDVAALISFLRSQEPVRNPVPAHALTPLGKAFMAFLIAPSGPAGAPPATSPPEAPTVERGEYLATVVANCAGCHSPRNMMDGSYIGPRFSGGTPMPHDEDPDLLLVPPNLTPDPETGWIASRDEDAFLARLRAGRLVEGSHMPWPLFGRMSDADIRAIYRYLRGLDPVRNETGPPVQRRSDRDSGGNGA